TAPAIVRPVPTLSRVRESNGRPRRVRRPGVTRPSLAAYGRHLLELTQETRNVVLETALLFEYARTHSACADLRGMRDAGRRSQGMVLDPPRAGGIGSTQGRACVNLARAALSRRSACRPRCLTETRR